MGFGVYLPRKEFRPWHRYLPSQNWMPVTHSISQKKSRSSPPWISTFLGTAEYLYIMTWGVAHGCRHGLWNNTTKIGLGDERLDTSRLWYLWSCWAICVETTTSLPTSRLKCGECQGNRLQQWTEQFGLVKMVKEYSEPANPYLCAADYNAAWYMEQFTSQYRLAWPI